MRTESRTNPPFSKSGLRVIRLEPYFSFHTYGPRAPKAATMHLMLIECRSRRHWQDWRQTNHQSPLCWWHRFLSRRGRRTSKFSWVSRQSVHSLRHGNQCREDRADGKQHQWHQHRDQRKSTEAWRLKPVRNDRSISPSSKIRLVRSLVTLISCMLLNHGPSQHSSKEKYKPWIWGAAAK